MCKFPKIKSCVDSFVNRIRPGEEIEREHEKSENRSSDGGQDPMKTTKKTSPLSKCVHAVIFVVKGNDRRLEKGIYTEPLRKIRAHFQRNGRSSYNHIIRLWKQNFTNNSLRNFMAIIMFSRSVLSERTGEKSPVETVQLQYMWGAPSRCAWFCPKNDNN